MKKLGWLVVLVSWALAGCVGMTIEMPSGPGETALAVAPPTREPMPLPTRGPLPTPVALAEDYRADALEETLINLYQRVSPAVVHIEVTGQFARPGSVGAGSGFVIDQAGHIVTNYHVIQDADRVRVLFADGLKVDAEMVGADPAVDLAVIKVDVPAQILVPVELGNSDVLRVGQRAIAIGNPFQFDQSMTVGIISALGRVVESDEKEGFIPALIQTDAAINPGNSGGPLLDSRGRVIGINTLIYSETGTSSGVGFAIPVNTLRRVLPALLAGREVGEPWLGVTGPPQLDAALVETLGLSTERGAYVQYVVPGSPAEEAGLVGAGAAPDDELKSGGDLIIAVDGLAVDSLEMLNDYIMREKRVGQTMDLTVVRGQEMRQVKVTLGERPQSP